MKRLVFQKLKEYFQSKKINIVGDISAVSYVTKPFIDEKGLDPRLVASSDPKSHITEQYRSIRTNIASLSPEKPVRAFLVTSSLRGEGKTVTAANFAYVFSQDLEKKTILIDTDLRKPTIHRIFNLPKEPGMSELLSGQVGLESFIDKPAADNLFVIPGGKVPANPVELLSSSRMKDLVMKLKEKFNWLVFDVAPILAVTDAGVLGNALDGSILVVRAGKTQAVDVERAYSLLLEANANPIGSIMTAVVTYIPYYLYRYRYIYSRHYYGA